MPIDQSGAAFDDNTRGAIHFKRRTGAEDFLNFITRGSADPVKKNAQGLRSLHLYLNEAWHDDYFDDTLAAALQAFNANGSKSATLEKLYLHVEGDFLFTEYSHTLSSPATSKSLQLKDKNQELLPSNPTLHKILDVRQPLTPSDKFALTQRHLFKVHAKKKAFVSSLLSVQGVSQVEIEGPMEAALQRKIVTAVAAEKGLMSYDEGDEDRLSPGMLYELQMIPTEGQTKPKRGVKEQKVGEHRWPTEAESRVSLGWALEYVD